MVENKKNHFIPPEYLNPQLSTKLYRSTYNFLKRFHSERMFDEVCAELKMPKDYLLSDGNWVSVLFGARFAECVRRKTGDPEIYRKIGNYYLSPENINPFEYALIKNMSPFLMLKSIKHFTRKSNNVCQVDVHRHSLSCLTIEMKTDVPVYSDMVLNTLGVAEAFKDLYGLSDFDVQVKVDNPEKISSYSFTVQFSAWAYYLRRVKTFGSYLLIGLCIGIGLLEVSYFAKESLLPILTALLLLCTMICRNLWQNLKTLRGQSEHFDERVREKNYEVYAKAELLERRYNEAKLLKDLSSQLVACRDSIEVINQTLRACRDLFNYNRVAVFMLSRERGVLSLRSSVGFEAVDHLFGQVEFKYPNPDAKDGFIASVLERGETTLILDVDTYKMQLKEHNRKMLDALEVGSMLLSPIQSGDKKYGILVAVRTNEEAPLSHDDKFLIENITAQLSLHFESVANYENESHLRQIFQKYVPRPVLEQVVHDDYQSTGSLKPKRGEICSVFMDLRGFTSASEELPPEKVFDLINLFSRFATGHLAAHGAIIDNIIGDEIVSFFLPSSDEEERVGQCARALTAVAEMVEGFSSFQRDLRRHAFPNLRLGVGVHFGLASIGSVGSEFKMNYTALGRTVNIASRLQSFSKVNKDDAIAVVVSKDVLRTIGLGTNWHFESEVLRGTNEPTEFAFVGEEQWREIRQHLKTARAA